MESSPRIVTARMEWRIRDPSTLQVSCWPRVVTGLYQSHVVSRLSFIHDLAETWTRRPVETMSDPARSINHAGWFFRSATRRTAAKVHSHAAPDLSAARNLVVTRMGAR